jgi:hypothetical protein
MTTTIYDNSWLYDGRFEAIVRKLIEAGLLDISSEELVMTEDGLDALKALSALDSVAKKQASDAADAAVKEPVTA